MNIKTLAHIETAVRKIKSSNPRFTSNIKFSKDSEDYLLNLCTMLSQHLIPKMDKETMLLVEGSTRSDRLERIVEKLSLAVLANDTYRFDILVTSLACQFNSHPETALTTDCGCDSPASMTEVEGEGDPKGEGHDPDCIGKNLDFMCWTTLVCVPTMACIMKHAQASIERVYMGHCDNEGGPACKCFAISFPTAVMILLILLGGVILGGPILEAGALTVIRALLVRAGALAIA